MSKFAMDKDGVLKARRPKLSSLQKINTTVAEKIYWVRRERGGGEVGGGRESAQVNKNAKQTELRHLLQRRFFYLRFKNSKLA